MYGNPSIDKIKSNIVNLTENKKTEYIYLYCFFKVSHIRKDKDYSFSLILSVKTSICVGKILELRIISKINLKYF